MPAQTEDVWSRVFKAGGAQYKDSSPVLFRDAVSSACGMASSQTGPFYCPADKKVYLDLSFFDELEAKYKAAGDFAQAYVIAHEVGHHVQNLLGTLGKINELKSRAKSPVEQNALQVKVELQADCYAGIWANHSQQARRWFDAGDIAEAINAAAAVGDDALQRRAGSSVNQESFTHGSSQQRQAWFRIGNETGSVQRCDTFTNRQP